MSQSGPKIITIPVHSSLVTIWVQDYNNTSTACTELLKLWSNIGRSYLYDVINRTGRISVTLAHCISFLLFWNIMWYSSLCPIVFMNLRPVKAQETTLQSEEQLCFLWCSTSTCSWGTLEQGFCLCPRLDPQVCFKLVGDKPWGMAEDNTMVLLQWSFSRTLWACKDRWGVPGAFFVRNVVASVFSFQFWTPCDESSEHENYNFFMTNPLRGALLFIYVCVCVCIFI